MPRYKLEYVDIFIPGATVDATEKCVSDPECKCTPCDPLASIVMAVAGSSIVELETWSLPAGSSVTGTGCLEIDSCSGADTIACDKGATFINLTKDATITGASKIGDAECVATAKCAECTDEPGPVTVGNIDVECPDTCDPFGPFSVPEWVTYTFDNVLGYTITVTERIDLVCTSPTTTVIPSLDPETFDCHCYNAAAQFHFTLPNPAFLCTADGADWYITNFYWVVDYEFDCEHRLIGFEPFITVGITSVFTGDPPPPAGENMPSAYWGSLIEHSETPFTASGVLPVIGPAGPSCATFSDVSFTIAAATNPIGSITVTDPSGADAGAGIPVGNLPCTCCSNGELVVGTLGSGCLGSTVAIGGTGVALPLVGGTGGVVTLGGEIGANPVRVTLEFCPLDSEGNPQEGMVRVCVSILAIGADGIYLPCLFGCLTTTYDCEAFEVDTSIPLYCNACVDPDTRVSACCNCPDVTCVSGNTIPVYIALAP